MPQWVKNLVDAATAGMRALADAAMERILWVYNIMVAIGVAARNGWGLLTYTAVYWRDATFRFAHRVHGTLWYIIFVRIPQVVGNAVNSTIAYLAALIIDLEQRITSIIIIVRDWLAARINDVIDFARRLRDWIAQEVSELWNLLTRTAELVFMLLTSPQRMAAWVAAALLQYVLAFLWQNIDAIVDLIRDRATHYAGLVALRIEHALVRFL